VESVQPTLLGDVEGGLDSVMKLLQRGVIAASFNLELELPVIARLLHRYHSQPMSFADACLVRMSEQHTSSPIITLDSDFLVYRKNGRQVIPTLMPK